MEGVERLLGRTSSGLELRGLLDVGLGTLLDLLLIAYARPVFDAGYLLVHDGIGFRAKSPFMRINCDFMQE